jgi:hypothetical protein
MPIYRRPPEGLFRGQPMSANLDTWDTAIDASDTGGADTGAEVVAVSETPETTTEVPAESTTETPAEEVAAPSGDADAGEVEAAAEEASEDDDEEKNDPPELQHLPSKSAQRRQARREMVERLKTESAVVQSYLDPSKPISSVSEDLEQRSPSRYHELVDDFFENHGEQYLKKRYGLEAKELDAIVEGRSAKPDSTPADPDYDPLEDALIPDHIKDEIREGRALKEKFPALEEKVNSIETKEQERERVEAEAKSRAIEGEVFEAVFPVIGEAIKEYGLEPSKDDPPQIAALKKIGARLLVEDVDPAFMKDEQNQKALGRVKEFAKRHERDNAFRETDALKVRSRAAAEAVRQGEEVSTILWAIKQLVTSDAKRIAERGKGQPPVPAGAPAGGQVVPKKEITSWDEALASVGQ